jgi:maltose O-acetyltransferase
MKKLLMQIKYLLIKLLSKIFSLLEKAYQADIYRDYREKYDIHKTFVFNGKGILMYGEGEIRIGENSYIGRYSLIQSSYNYQVIIGKNCKIGPNFSVWTQSSYVDHDYNYDEKIIPKLGNIIIKDAVWIGANVIVSPGVIVGENSIIGANSIVTKDVPPFSIVGGVPAIILRYKNITVDKSRNNSI